jgi:hypothetical protein
VSLDTYWTVKKVLDFEEWLGLNGFTINARRTKWIDFTKIMFMIKYNSEKDTIGYKVRILLKSVLVSI